MEIFKRKHRFIHISPYLALLFPPIYVSVSTQVPFLFSISCSFKEDSSKQKKKCFYIFRNKILQVQASDLQAQQTGGERDSTVQLLPGETHLCWA